MEVQFEDSHRSALLLLSALAAIGALGAIGVGVTCPIALDAAVVLGFAGGILFGVAQARRTSPSPPARDAEPASVAGVTTDAPFPWVIVAIGWVAIFADLCIQFASRGPPPAVPSLVAAAFCFLAIGGAALTAHYFGGVDSSRLLEAAALQRGARATAWMLAAISVAIGAAWAGQEAVVWGLHLMVLSVIAIACVQLFRARNTDQVFSIELGIFAVLGRRPNVFGSVLEAARDQLGIDLRSTWALHVARRYLQPLMLGLCLLGWLSTGVTEIALGEEGIVERLGIAASDMPLSPGLHAHWPWPVDRVIRIQASLVRTLNVGHEGAEVPGPENVLWTREHATREYTLLLGDGRDLITVDAAVQYRIIDAKAWTYRCQNPTDALRAIAYQAVMRATVDRTLAEALSENVTRLTRQIQETIQSEADSLGLGVEIVGFTIAGMHPPVAVAHDYQAVVSAALGKETAIASAQADRNETVPAAEAETVVSTNAAWADAATALARAAGGALSFRALESQYTAAPEEYRFRRRLETLEMSLQGRHLTIVDARIMRDGGDLWLMK